jgi:hypothetical protein
MIHPDTLKTMERPQLMELAGKLDIKVHHKAKDETVRKQILEQVASRQMAKTEEPAPKPVAPVFNHTEEEILQAIGDLATKEGFNVKFPKDNTVIFTYRGISESVNMSIPMHVIVRQAKMAAKVKMAPAMVNDGQGGKVMML